MKKWWVLAFTVLSGALIFTATAARKQELKKSPLPLKQKLIQPSVKTNENPDLDEIPTYYIPKGMAVFVIE